MTQNPANPKLRRPLAECVDTLDIVSSQRFQKWPGTAPAKDKTLRLNPRSPQLGQKSTQPCRRTADVFRPVIRTERNTNWAHLLPLTIIDFETNSEHSTQPLRSSRSKDCRTERSDSTVHSLRNLFPYQLSQWCDLNAPSAIATSAPCGNAC